MSKPKFKVGDKIIGTKKANTYTTTREGWIGKVIEIVDDSCIGDIKVKGESPIYGIDTFIVDSNGFELYKPEKIIIYRNGSEVIAKNTLTGKTGVAKCNPADEFDFETGAEIAFNRLLGDSVHHNFKVGDRVIGTKAANNMYGITNAGWKGVVTKKCSCGDIVVEGVDDDSVKVQFCVCPNYFKLDKTETPKPKYYTGKVVCIESPDKDFTVGKIYKFESGKTQDNGGNYRPIGYYLKELEDDRCFTNSYKFVPLIED